VNEPYPEETIRCLNAPYLDGIAGCFQGFVVCVLSPAAKFAML